MHKNFKKMKGQSSNICIRKSKIPKKVFHWPEMIKKMIKKNEVMLQKTKDRN